MLPIAGFDHFDDDYLLNIDDVIQAINQITGTILTIDILRIFEEKGLIETTFALGRDLRRVVMQWPDAPAINKHEVELVVIKISKRNALKLLDIAMGKDKQQAMMFKEPHVDRKTDRYLFVKACIETYMNGYSEFPSNAESLLKYCCINRIEGFLDLEDNGGKDKERRIYFTGDKRTYIRWSAFIEILGKFKEVQS